MFGATVVGLDFGEAGAEGLIQSNPPCQLVAESLSILCRGDEGFDHFGVKKASVELVELAQPEIITSVVGVWRIIWIASEKSKVLQQNESPV